MKGDAEGAGRGGVFISNYNAFVVCSLYNKPFSFFNATSGSSVAIIRATDRDNDPMVFSLDPSIQDLLQIDNTGNLTLQKELDREVSWKMAITFQRMKQIR